MDFDGAWSSGCMAPVSSLGAVVSWEDDDSGGEAQAVLGSYCVASAGGVVRMVAVWKHLHQLASAAHIATR